MSDKLRPGVVVTPTFVDGEAPSAAKLNSISVQMKAASEALEKAVGDVHSQSFPYLTGSLTTLSPSWAKRTITGNDLSGAAERDLDIANLARLIGPASNLNPRMLESQSLTENVPIGVYSFQLTFDPSNTPVFSDAVVFATEVTNLSNLKNAGEYHVTATGTVFVVTVTAGGTVTYNTNPTFKGGGMSPQDARFNVLPDPNQISAGGAGLSWSAPDPNGRRTATLPTITHSQSNYAGTAVALDATDPLFGQQLKLPAVLADNFTAGDVIPEGFLYVKNETTNEVYEDGEYIADTATTILVGNIDNLTDNINAGHKFSIITVGSDITSSIDDLRRKSFHSHDRTFGEPPVHIKDIVGIYESNTYNPSDKDDNWLSQYLHRDGWDSTRNTDQNNINDQNAMRGPFLMGKSVANPGEAVAAAGTFTHSSHPIYFSNEEVSIQRLATDSLRLLNSVNAGKVELITTDAGHIELTSDGDVNLSAVGIIDAQTAFVTTAGIRGPESTSALVKSYADNSYTLDSPPASGTWWSVGNGVNGPALPVSITNIIGIQFFMKPSGDTVWYPPNVSFISGSRNYNYGLRINDTGGDWAIYPWDDGGNTSKWLFAEQGINIECKFVIWYV